MSNSIYDWPPDKRERFSQDGMCWCPDSRTLGQLRHMGHSPDCRRAREGWRANYALMRQQAEQRRADEELGRAWRLAAARSGTPDA